MTFPALPDSWEPTRSALHAAAAAMGAVARAAVPAHPRWWHLSLTVTEGGMVTDPIPLPDGRTATLVLDLVAHGVRIVVDGDTIGHVPLDAGLDGVELGERIFSSAAALGLDAAFDRERLHSDDAGAYDRDHSAAFWLALREVAAALEGEKQARPGETGPVQVWPHGFDIAFEWFGSRVVDGDDVPAPAQLNLGWYPAGEAYFYSTPWPFDSALLEVELPHGATWHTEGWQGSELAYAPLVEAADGPAAFSEYATAVFEAARVTLTA